MLRNFAHIVLILGVTFGVLLPKMSAVLIHVVPGLQTIVICTGTQMRTITINEDGDPVEVSEAATPHCAISDLPQLALSEPPLWIALSRVFTTRFQEKLNPDAFQHLRHRHDPTRAPPVLT